MNSPRNEREAHHAIMATIKATYPRRFPTVDRDTKRVDNLLDKAVFIAALLAVWFVGVMAFAGWV